MSKLNFKNINFIIIFIFIISIATHVLLSVCFYNEIDIINFHLDWAFGMDKGFFDAYSNIKSLDYPPLFPTLLYTIKNFLADSHNASSSASLMFWLKFYPILFNQLIGVFVYFVLKDKNKKFAYLATALWLFSPAFIINCACWGQTDCILAFFLMLTFYLFYKRYPILATFFYAISALLKLQALYLAPLVLCEIIYFCPNKTKLKSILVGALTYILGWLPFMIGSHDILLPFKIVFGGFGRYQMLSSFALNVYQIIPGVGINAQINTPFTKGVDLVSTFILVFLIIGLFAFYYHMKKKNMRYESALIGFVYINAIFMLTTKMHERYQLPALALLFLSYIIYKNSKFLKLYLFMSAIAFLNQGLFLFKYGTYRFIDNYKPLLEILSLLNVILFIYTMYLLIVFYKKKTLLTHKTF